MRVNPLNTELNPICHLLALLGSHHILHISGLRVNISNTQKFRLREAEIEEVGSFVHLGSVMSEGGGTEEEVASRIKKASGVSFQLYPVWRNLSVSKEVKTRMFNPLNAELNPICQ